MDSLAAVDRAEENVAAEDIDRGDDIFNAEATSRLRVFRVPPSIRVAVVLQNCEEDCNLSANGLQVHSCVFLNIGL